MLKNLILIVIIFSLFTNNQALAYITEISILKRNFDTIILLSDCHNVGSTQQINDQSKLLNSFLKNLNSQSKEKIRFLYELSIAFSITDNSLKFENWEIDQKKITGNIIGKVEFFLVESTDQTKINYKKLGVKRNFSVEITPKEFIPLFFILPEISKYDKISQRSIDPRHPIIPDDISKNENESDAIKGCLYTTDILLALRKNYLLATDYKILSKLMNQFSGSIEFKNWMHKANHYKTDFMMSYLNDVYLMHYMDLGTIIDLLSHPEMPIKILFVGAIHAEYIKDKLIHDFNFSLHNLIGLPFSEITSEKFKNSDFLNKLECKQHVIGCSLEKILNPISDFLINSKIFYDYQR